MTKLYEIFQAAWSRDLTDDELLLGKRLIFLAQLDELANPLNTPEDKINIKDWWNEELLFLKRSLKERILCGDIRDPKTDTYFGDIHTSSI